MTPDQEANGLLIGYWRSGGETDLAVHVRSLVCASPPLRTVTAGRCLTVIESLDNVGGWDARVEKFRSHVAKLRTRDAQADQLGDPSTDPHAVIEILSDDLADSFDAGNLDAEALRRARSGKATRAAAASAFLANFGWDNLQPHAGQQLKACITAAEQRAHEYRSFALFESPWSLGLPLGVNLEIDASGTIDGYNQADAEMTQQATSVLKEFLAGRGARWGLEYESTFGGSSIGLALWLAAEVALGLRNTDPWLAATGRLAPGGRVCSVGGVQAKVSAALAAGYRRILVPGEDWEAAHSAAAAFQDRNGDQQQAAILPVASIGDVNSALNALGGRLLGVDGTARVVRDSLPAYGLALTKEEQLKNCRRLEIADAEGTASIDVFSGRRATVKVNGTTSSSTVERLKRLNDERLPHTPVSPRKALTVVIPTDEHLAKLTESLLTRGAQTAPTTGEHEVYRYVLQDGGSKATITGYTTKKATVQGTAPAHDQIVEALAHALEGLAGAPTPPAPPELDRDSTRLPNSPAPVKNRSASTENPAHPYFPHIGTDEAGKGDYFGPLVCAAVFVDADDAVFLTDLGVRDSKRISDRRILSLAQQIRGRMGGRFAVITIKPARYNTLTAEFKAEGMSLNFVVAWGHVRSIRNLLEHPIRVNHVLIDKFGDERYILDKLPPGYEHLTLEQRVHAESDIAVAAASILAREAFLNWIARESENLGMTIPKGAGPQVIEAAKELVAKRGRDALDQYAKTAFRTTRSVLDET